MNLRAKYIVLMLFISSCSVDLDIITPEGKDFVMVETSVEESWEHAHNEWIYARMKSDYLWNEDMPDSSHLDFSQSPLKFFQSLLSDEDRFSYCDINHEYSGSSAFFSGVDYQGYEDAEGKTVFRVLKRNDDSVGFERGDWFIFRDGQPVYGNMLKGVFIEGVRPDRVFTTPVKDTVYHIGGMHIGYIVYDRFESYADFGRSVISLKGRSEIDDLVLDLRYNPGGYVEVCRQVASLLVPKEYLGGLFQMWERNRLQISESIEKNGGTGLDSLWFADNVRVRELNLGLERLYVLTTANSASASEALIHCLRPYLKVITVGSTTRGKNVGSTTFSDDDFRYSITPITFKYLDKDGKPASEYGIPPDIMAQDDLDHLLGDTEESMLKAAVTHITGGNPIPEMRKSISDVLYPRVKGKSTISERNNL